MTDVATQMRLLSSYGKALTSLLMTEHNLNEPINNYTKKYTMCCLGLSDCERTNGTSSVSEADTHTSLQISKKIHKFLHFRISH